MPRRSTQRSPEAPEEPPSKMRLPRNLIQSPTPVPSDLKSEIVANWSLSSDNINTCVPPERWPLRESNPEKWSINIVRLLHEASGLSKGKNDFFQNSLSIEIFTRQTKNRSLKGKEEHMTVTDLKHVCKHLRNVAEGTAEHEEKEKQKAAQKSRKENKDQQQNGNDSKPARRGRSNGAPPDPPPSTKKKTTAPRGKPRPQRNGVNKTKEADKAKEVDQPQETDKENNSTSHPPQKRLPIRTTRSRRGPKSPQTKIKLPPPVTPANPPEDSASEASEEKNTPPEPVSGRHIYGDFIKPTTITFPTETSPPAPALGQRTTRKRARAEAEERETAPTAVQVDSDPRDIDATGFLSELDPREARRRRKPRLSGLVGEPVDEPAWSQDVAPLETPLDTPLDTPLLTTGTPGLRNGEGGGRDGDGDEEILGIEMLTALLPRIPECATEEERGVLEDRIRLIHRDIGAYKRSVAEISKRGED
ncbi:hypothetical protein E8E13_004524 [Curvularia kusanoi]|uniref:Uncharacterized protein n=1 Tax=Curvularia kusanoi TaxID=90978 RepID=A0A9P4W709_CURKU|nr:hypothetical protein E8E13_004524 [Curvularia kusanoi]